MNLHDAAVGYAHNGLPVLPLLPRSKRPATRHGFRDATTDPEQVSDYWQRHPHASIGIRPLYGVFVVDVDPRNGGDRELRKLIRFRGPLPETWTAATGSDGLHYWFTVEEVDEIRSHLCNGVDIKHGGTGFVVAPPSVHPNGKQYQWLIPPDGDPAPAPTWLRLAIQKPRPVERYGYTLGGISDGGSGEYSLDCLVARISAAPEGHRNRTLYGAAKDALRQGDLDMYEPFLVAAALGTGLTQSEVDATLRSVRRGGVA
jgi:Bifunctional DNA primase/polymerase, N-terminal